MAAAVVSASEYDLDLERLAEFLGNLRSVADAGLDGLMIPFKFKIAIPATSVDDDDDKVRICKFPAGFFLSDFAATLTDMDTHATPSLAGKFVLADDDDATQLDVTASTDAGEAGGSVAIAPGAKGAYVGGLSLLWHTTGDASTEAAGTITVYFVLHRGIIAEDKDVLYLQSY
jgi:hypothetical protein